MVQRNLSHQFHRRVPKPIREIFRCAFPNSLVNVILPRFLQVQDFFYILASLVQIQEMIIWSTSLRICDITL